MPMAHQFIDADDDAGPVLSGGRLVYSDEEEALRAASRRAYDRYRALKAQEPPADPLALARAEGAAWKAAAYVYRFRYYQRHGEDLGVP
jgi:hypothetical protein